MSYPTISREEVAKRNQKQGGVFIINNGVYEVTQFYDDHPGGRDVLLAKIGTDATEDFEAVRHSSGAMRKLEALRVGTLPEAEQRKFIHMAEVETKKNVDAAWFVINNKVYDVTKFLDMHPGGRDVLLYNAGQDATEAFTNNGHSDNAYRMMTKYFIGDLDLGERKKFVERLNTGSAHQGSGDAAAARGADAGHASGAERGKREDASLLERLQEQLMLIMMLAVFLMAGYVLLR